MVSLITRGSIRTLLTTTCFLVPGWRNRGDKHIESGEDGVDARMIDGERNSDDDDDVCDDIDSDLDTDCDKETPNQPGESPKRSLNNDARMSRE